MQRDFRGIMNTEQLIEWKLAGENEVLGENLLQCHLVHKKSHRTWPGIESGQLRWEVSDLPTPAYSNWKKLQKHFANLWHYRIFHFDTLLKNFILNRLNFRILHYRWRQVDALFLTTILGEKLSSNYTISPKSPFSYHVTKYHFCPHKHFGTDLLGRRRPFHKCSAHIVASCIRVLQAWYALTGFPGR
jgi:hypothetical protein